jgi:hypothetical protein
MPRCTQAIHGESLLTVFWAPLHHTRPVVPALINQRSLHARARAWWHARRYDPVDAMISNLQVCSIILCLTGLKHKQSFRPIYSLNPGRVRWWSWRRDRGAPNFIPATLTARHQSMTDAAATPPMVKTATATQSPKRGQEPWQSHTSFANRGSSRGVSAAQD